MRQSAGTLLYREGANGLEVLLVHPSGPYNRGAPWSVPKGEPEAGESLEEAARRETLEETGMQAPPVLVSVGTVKYRSGKVVHGFAGRAEPGQPSCGSWEVDAAEFLPVDRAREVLLPAQQPLIDRLEAYLAETGQTIDAGQVVDHGETPKPQQSIC